MPALNSWQLVDKSWEWEGVRQCCRADWRLAGCCEVVLCCDPCCCLPAGTLCMRTACAGCCDGGEEGGSRARHPGGALRAGQASVPLAFAPACFLASMWPASWGVALLKRHAGPSFLTPSAALPSASMPGWSEKVLTTRHTHSHTHTACRRSLIEQGAAGEVDWRHECRSCDASPCGCRWGRRWAMQ